MFFELNENTPIYIQLAEQIKIDIISGNLQPGERLLSVRELALKSQINPNTVQRALAELEQTGLVYTERTNGKFVTEDALLIESFKKEYARKLTERFLKSMESIGLDKATALNYIEKNGGNK